MKLDIVINSKGRIFQMQLMMAPSISACVLVFNLNYVGVAQLCFFLQCSQKDRKADLGFRLRTRSTSFFTAGA